MSRDRGSPLPFQHLILRFSLLSQFRASAGTLSERLKCVVAQSVRLRSRTRVNVIFHF